jgi:hypothetical protein
MKINTSKEPLLPSSVHFKQYQSQLQCVMCLVVLMFPFFDPRFNLQPKFIIWFHHIHRECGAIEWVCLVTKQMPAIDKSLVSH